MGDEGATDPGAPDIWTPLALVARTVGSGENISVLARLKADVTRAQLQAQANVATEDFRREFPEDVGKELQLSYLPYQRMIGLDERPYLLFCSVRLASSCSLPARMSRISYSRAAACAGVKFLCAWPWARRAAESSSNC